MIGTTAMTDKKNLKNRKSIDMKGKTQNAYFLLGQR